MTPEAVVARAVAEGLEIIALTDHNAIANVDRALKAANGQPILVVPAVEVTTSQGHLLLYFPNLERLSAAMGKLTFSEDRKYCKQSFEDCLEVAKAHEGFGIAAHIELDAGFMQRVPGNTPVKAGILKHPALIALEIVNPASVDMYTDADSDGPRRDHARERREALRVPEDLPKVINSDAHSLAKLGRNAADAKRVTRLKMDDMTFDALRIALMEGSVRCRLEDVVPFKVPRLVGISFEGGFLDGQAVHFNSNLTCLIGGRGSGKSTVLEAVKAATGNTTQSDVVDSEVWADTINLWYEDELGNVGKYVRQRDAPPFDPDDAFGQCHFPLEAYGQGETAATIQRCGEDPGLLLGLLDRLVNIDDLELKDRDAVIALTTNADLIGRLARDVQSLPRYKQLHSEAEKKLKALETHKAAEVIKLEAALAQERAYYQELDSLLIELTPPRTVELPQFLDYLKGIEQAAVIVGKDPLGGVLLAGTDLEKALNERHESWKTYVAEFAKRVRAELEIWKTKETEERTKVDAKRRELESQGIELDMEFIRKLVLSKTEFDGKVRQLQTKDKELKEARRSRPGLVAARRSLRSDVYTRRVGFATRMTTSLVGNDEYRVTLKFREAAYSPEAETIITEAMGWRTSRVPRARMLVQQLTVPGIVDVLGSANGDAFGTVLDDQQLQLFDGRVQAELYQTLGREDVRARLESCRYDDLPDITIAKTVHLPGGGSRPWVRKFEKLSLGQQQAVVLSIFLHSESPAPLIIDQPEDNLDGEFVARVLVPHLRRIKERRQVIIATHNANIAVLADTELVVPLFAENESSRVYKPGSIDAQDTREQICRIVEGGKDSFVRRAKIYGVLK